MQVSWACLTGPSDSPNAGLLAPAKSPRRLTGAWVKAVVLSPAGWFSIMIARDRHTEIERDHLTASAALFSAHIEAAGA